MKPKTTRIDTNLYVQLSKLARLSGLSKRAVLEMALKAFLRQMAHSQEDLRGDVLEHFACSVRKNRQLLRLLAR